MARKTSAKRYFLTGLLAVIPLGVTAFILYFLTTSLAKIGRPLVGKGFKLLEEEYGVNPGWLREEAWIADGLAVIVVIVGIFFIGVIVSNIVGRQLFRLFEAILERIPFVKTIYGAVKKLVDLMNRTPGEGDVDKVVLIDFPNAEMKAIGLVTRTMKDPDTGKQLAAVYVPTTPNPTNGYLEILPVDRLTPTDWTFDQAMTFVVSAGATAPDELRFNRPPVSSALESDPNPALVEQTTELK
ncbi:MAG: DUF502 domain-containing protein [Verrucomicrobiota bacterium]